MGLGNSYFVEVGCFLGGWTSSVENFLGFDVFWFAFGVSDTASLHLLQLLPSWSARTLTFWAGSPLGVQLSAFRGRS